MQTYIILGIVASILLEIIKISVGGMDNWKSKLSIVAISLVAGGGYVYLTKNPDYLEVVLSILGTASVVYSFIVKDLVTSAKDRFAQEG